MWDGLPLLLSLSAVMAAASFLAGLLPLSFGLSKSHARTISSIGTGILVGTCLIVIIPEGVQTLYSASAAASAETALPSPSDSSRHRRQHDDVDLGQHHHDPHAWIGVGLIAGFILMYLIDQLPKHLSAGAFGRRPQLHISLANLNQGPHRVDADERLEGLDDEDDPLSSNPLIGTSRSGAGGSAATTLGLVIHAAADGIALGASSFLEKSSLGFIVFVAIMIHKAPAAFGLTSVLLKQGLSKRLAKLHLIIFSLAAPAGALATWLLVNIAVGGQMQGREESTRFATGLLLIFSGGTFLYVAMHTMQEGAGHADGTDGINGHDQGISPYAGALPRNSGHRGGQALQFRDTMLAVVGMLVPLLTQIGHAH